MDWCSHYRRQITKQKQSHREQTDCCERRERLGALVKKVKELRKKRIGQVIIDWTRAGIHKIVYREKHENYYQTLKNKMSLIYRDATFIRHLLEELLPKEGVFYI